MYSFYIHLRKQAKGADSIFAPIFILADAPSSQNVHKYLKFYIGRFAVNTILLLP